MGCTSIESRQIDTIEINLNSQINKLGQIRGTSLNMRQRKPCLISLQGNGIFRHKYSDQFICIAHFK